MNKTAVEILTEAQALVSRPNGWCKKYLEKDGAYCALGALNMAATGNVTTTRCGDEHEKADDAVRNVVKELIGTELMSAYNNAEDTTQQDIVNLFVKARLQLEEKVA